MPADHFLIETDCPWLAPQFRRGKRNESAYVTAVAEQIAELRQTTAVEIGQISSQNFRRLFLKHKKGREDGYSTALDGL